MNNNCIINVKDTSYVYSFRFCKQIKIVCSCGTTTSFNGEYEIWSHKWCRNCNLYFYQEEINNVMKLKKVLQ